MTTIIEALKVAHRALSMYTGWHNRELSLIDAALAAAREQQPVAWLLGEGGFTRSADVAAKARLNCRDVTPLYAAPPAQDAEDAARYQYMRTALAEKRLDYYALEGETPDAIDAKVDAARGSEHVR